jgi:hypothetical protein
MATELSNETVEIPLTSYYLHHLGEGAGPICGRIRHSMSGGKGKKYHSKENKQTL